ncbi:MAG: hypothetical protein D5R96_01585 [Methanocalculus sp. MSAO_Arc2]|uniref:hypothetical protein n=1 Tax=Methanocalculus sp. MSAO_Arc2 TaxID=2293855 RepID=UPI000FF7CE83|nr:MAG: hypothetical protein D5R96_01585 [Methanocalculus sp. MSAO_Arc2]
MPESTSCSGYRWTTGTFSLASFSTAYAAASAALIMKNTIWMMQYVFYAGLVTDHHLFPPVQ